MANKARHRRRRRRCCRRNTLSAIGISSPERFLMGIMVAMDPAALVGGAVVAAVPIWKLAAH